MSCSAQALYHAEVPKCLLDCFFLIRRALGLFSVLRLLLIVVLTINDTALLFYLCDIQATDFQAAMLQHVILNFLVGKLQVILYLFVPKRQNLFRKSRNLFVKNTQVVY